MINWNEHNLKIGDRVIVDATHPNKSEVVIQRFTPNQMYAVVKADDGDEWQTMTSRLTPIKKMTKQSLNIGLSSMRCWLYLDGDMNKPPIRAFADANCDVCIGDYTRRHEGRGEQWDNLKRVEYSPNHVVKIRGDADTFVDETYYGKIQTKPGNSPFLNDEQNTESC